MKIKRQVVMARILRRSHPIEIASQSLAMTAFKVLARWLRIGILIAWLLGQASFALSAQETPGTSSTASRPTVISAPGVNVPIVEGDLPPRNDSAALRSLGLILSGMLLFGAWMILKRFRPQARIANDTLADRQLERRRLLVTIAELDDRRAQGLIEEQPYLAERQCLKRQLVELTIQNRPHRFSKSVGSCE